MNIMKKQENDTLVVALEGRLDTTTAPELDRELKASTNGVKTLTFDFAKLEYISSAGLRVLLSTQKIMNKQGEMIIKNVNDTILEVFDITGFSSIMNIQ